ncbi:MAG TPA: hypothetical protein VKT32_15175 [Chthonomonadaceae bacterium]|nr:hypothetical protein [Chthonomonadaceae bacterium]
MKQNVSPTIIGIAIAIVLLIVGVIGYLNFHQGNETAPGVTHSTISQQYQNRVTQERPQPGAH